MRKHVFRDPKGDTGGRDFFKKDVGGEGQN